MAFQWQPDGSSFYKFFLKLGLRLYASASGYIGLQVPATVTTPYSITLAAVLPTSQGIVAIDSSGNITHPFIAYDRSAIVFLGDSRLAQVFADNAQLVKAQTNFFTNAQQLMAQRMSVAGNFAVSGLRSDQYLASQYTSQAFATNAYWVMIGGITNDIVNTGATIDYWIANIKPVVQAWVAQGRGVILMAETGSTAYAGVAASLGAVNHYNRQIKQYARETPNVVVWDEPNVVLDPTQAMAFKSGYSLDGTHIITVTGAQPCGVSFAALMTPLIPLHQPLVNSIGAVFANGAVQWFSNPMWTTTSGGTAVTGITGTIPAGITSGAMGTGQTATISTTAGTYGNDLVLAITATQSGQSHVSLSLSANIASANVGDTFFVNCEYTIAASSVNFQGMMLNLNAQTSTSNQTAQDGLSTTGAGNLPTTAQTLTLETQQMTIVGTGSVTVLVAGLYFNFSGAGSATLNIRRLGIWRRQAN